MLLLCSSTLLSCHCGGLRKSTIPTAGLHKSPIPTAGLRQLSILTAVLRKLIIPTAGLRKISIPTGLLHSCHSAPWAALHPTPHAASAHDTSPARPNALGRLLPCTQHAPPPQRPLPCRYVQRMHCDLDTKAAAAQQQTWDFNEKTHMLRWVGRAPASPTRDPGSACTLPASRYSKV